MRSSHIRVLRLLEAASRTSKATRARDPITQGVRDPLSPFGRHRGVLFELVFASLVEPVHLATNTLHRRLT